MDTKHRNTDSIEKDSKKKVNIKFWHTIVLYSNATRLIKGCFYNLSKQDGVNQWHVDHSHLAMMLSTRPIWSRKKMKNRRWFTWNTVWSLFVSYYQQNSLWLQFLINTNTCIPDKKDKQTRNSSKQAQGSTRNIGLDL